MRFSNSRTPQATRVKASSKRKSLGKTLRFEVFKRDYFTCQYCGSQPPAVVLVIDHVVPVAGGGASSIDNLVTSCEPCNQGKSDRPLGQVIPRTDGDLLYLTTQQEIAEMVRYQQSLARKEAALASLVSSLVDAWDAASGLDWAPTDGIIRAMLNKYEPDVVGEALVEVAGKFATGYLKDNTRWVQYLWAVARNIAADREAD